jgi:hypothetical protein
LTQIPIWKLRDRGILPDWEFFSSKFSASPENGCGFFLIYPVFKRLPFLAKWTVFS